MGARSNKKDPYKTCLSKSELRAMRLKENVKNQKASALIELTKEDIKIQKIEDEQAHFAQLSATLLESKKQDPVEKLLNYVKEDSEVKVEEKEATTEEKICEDYNNGSTIKEIAQKFAITEYKARTILLNNGVKMRPRGFNLSKVNATENQEVAVEVKEEINIKKPEESDSNVLPDDNFMFADQEFSNNKIKRMKFKNSDENVFFAGLVKDRHEIPFVDKYVFETLTQSNFNTPEYCENKAKGFINAYIKPDPSSGKFKTLVVYCTGLQLALSALVSVCAQLQVNLITMHLNAETKKFIPQKTLCIFGNDIPNVNGLIHNPLKPLSERYGKIFTYDCTIEDLLQQEKCIYIKACYGEKYANENNSVIILSNKEFPEVEQWKLFGDLVQSMQKEDLPDKHHSVILGRINISMDGYQYGELITKSFNYRNDVNKTK